MSTTRQAEVWAKIDGANSATNTVEENLDLYSQWAPSYDLDVTEMRPKGPAIVAKVLELIFGENKDALILDAGAGTGWVGKAIQKRGFTNLEALDGSQEMLNIANQKGIYKRSICGLLGPNRLDIESGILTQHNVQANLMILI
ncbi:methyltransferase-like protein 27 [Lingula anatina]|uniref:Methyltransferase-like protein 27 n=1 Tax=Lingula anatina TaxID=7574 RepID=A0A1S3IG51_LINAN|nr:methyltransferase-like protein 27 [Lingula anatina]|eukprot:XP_013397118.1 methyltransferase-like protein 27 [Lingula anatina]